ncbi:MAG: adenylosuccinate lyase [Armatimonadetes bacterium]|nr:adenylosuccinate lyase [Armatimonadota bacterium]
MNTFGYDTYLSPATWRYGSREMRAIFSEVNRRRHWRRVWAAIAQVKCEIGLITAEQLADIEAHVDEVNVERSLEIERTLQHDLAAEAQAFAEQCPVGGQTLHTGATSADITDNADALIVGQALELIRSRLAALLRAYEQRITELHRERLVGLGFTHIQPAQPVPFAYRLANHAQDLLRVLWQLEGYQVEAKGIKGAVGTGADYTTLLEGTGISFREFQERVMRKLGLSALTVTGQTATRLIDVEYMSILYGLAATLHRIFTDQRLLQSMGETQEPFAKGQKGSSVMAYKKNPKDSEQICALSAAVMSFHSMAGYAAANNLLERTLNESAIRRVFIPEAFLFTDHCLIKARKVIAGLVINREKIARDLRTHGDFAGTGRLLVHLQQIGVPREEAYRMIQSCSLQAQEALVRGEENPLRDLLLAAIHALPQPEAQALTAEELASLVDASGYVGGAPELVEEFLAELRAGLAAYPAADTDTGESVF